MKLFEMVLIGGVFKCGGEYYIKDSIDFASRLDTKEQVKFGKQTICWTIKL